MTRYKTTWRETGVKICTKCGVEKTMGLFTFSRGYAGWCKECHAKSTKETDTRTPEQRRFKHLKRAYNLTPEEFSLMVLEQGGLCASCQKQNDNLCVDHDHDTGVIRGLLCQKCNSGIGLLGDNLEGLEKAVNYLKRNIPEEV